MAFCDELIARNYDLNIWAYARVDTVRPHMLEKLRKAGIKWLALGIEFGSEHVRDGAEKSFTQSEIIDIIRQIQQAGLSVIGNFIFGLPDDDLATMQQTLDLAVELNCEFANFYSAMAYPGSPLFARRSRTAGRCQKRGAASRSTATTACRCRPKSCPPPTCSNSATGFRPLLLDQTLPRHGHAKVRLVGADAYRTHGGP